MWVRLQFPSATVCAAAAVTASTIQDVRSNPYCRDRYRQRPRSQVGSGRAVARAVSRLLPTAAVPALSQAKAYGICGGQRGTGAGFLRVLRFPSPIVPTAPHASSSIIGAGALGRMQISQMLKLEGTYIKNCALTVEPVSWIQVCVVLLICL
jgi:hypothetical protein